jgi:hypothetical protein
MMSAKDFDNQGWNKRVVNLKGVGGFFQELQLCCNYTTSMFLIGAIVNIPLYSNALGWNSQAKASGGSSGQDNYGIFLNPYAQIFFTNQWTLTLGTFMYNLGNAKYDANNIYSLAEEHTKPAMSPFIRLSFKF